MADINEFRGKINDIDRRLVSLLNERAAAALEIAKVKGDQGLPVYAPDREASVLRSVAALTNGPLPASAITSIYREIISSTWALQKVLEIGRAHV